MINQIQLRSLQTQSGKIAICAFDHRGSLSSMLGVNALDSFGRKSMEQFKETCMSAFSPVCSGVLVDEEYGTSSLSARDPSCGLLMTLERFSYDSTDPETLPEIFALDGIERIVARGAGVKFFLDYHPSEPLAEEKRAYVSSLFRRTRQLGSVFLVEPVMYHPKTQSREEFVHEFPKTQLKMVHEFGSLCDVLKIQFPMLADEVFDPVVAGERCNAITTASSVPWIILSRETPFERYLRGLEIALKNGCTGFAVGRALWQEVGSLATEKEQHEFIRTTAVNRLHALMNLL